MNANRPHHQDSGRGKSSSQYKPLGRNQISTELLSPSKMTRKTTIDLTGEIARETSHRQNPPDVSRRTTTATHSTSRPSNMDASFSTHKTQVYTPSQVRITLRSLDGDLHREIVLTSERKAFELGRASNNADRKMQPRSWNAWIASPIISRRHCRIYVEHLPAKVSAGFSFPEEFATRILDKKVWLKDLASTHGTYINKGRIADGQPRCLSHGDRITLGIDVVNGPATYHPKTFEVKFQWEDKYASPIWRPTRFDRDNRPSASSSIPTPAESPEQLMSKTFSVPNESDSDADLIILTAERKSKATPTGKAAASHQSSQHAESQNPSALKSAGNIQIQVPETRAGMSQIPVVTFSDSDSDEPESLPILKLPLSKRSSKRSTPKPEENKDRSSSIPVHEKHSTCKKSSHEAARTSPDYSPAYDNKAPSSPPKASQKPSQPAENDLASEEMEIGSEFDDVYEILSEDDWLSQELDSSSAEDDPHRPYGDDPEEAENELVEYPSFKPRRGSVSSASSNAGSSQAAKSFQLGQSHIIRVPESSSSDSESDSEDDADEEEDPLSKAQTATDLAARPNSEGEDFANDQDAQAQSEIRKDFDAANVIAMLRSQPPPSYIKPAPTSEVRHPRCHALGRSDNSLPEPTRFVFGDNFDTSPAAPAHFPPYPPLVPYTQGPFSSSPAIDTAGSAVDGVNSYFTTDNGLPYIDLERGFVNIDGQAEQADNQRPVINSFHPIPEPVSEPPKSRSTRVSIADIVNLESPGSIGQKRKADNITGDDSRETGMTYYEMNDNTLVHSSSKGAETGLDGATRRQLNNEVRVANYDPGWIESHDTLPDAQPRSHPLLATETFDQFDFDAFLGSVQEGGLKSDLLQYENAKKDAFPRILEDLENEEATDAQPQPVFAIDKANDVADTEADAEVSQENPSNEKVIADSQDDDNSANNEPPRKKRRVSSSPARDVSPECDNETQSQTSRLSPSPAMVAREWAKASSYSMQAARSVGARAQAARHALAERHAQAAQQARTNARSSRRFTWRSFVTGAVTGAAAVLGAAAAIVATVPAEVRDEVMREW